MKEDYKAYMFFSLSFLLCVYLFAVLILALLTSINSISGYPLYNFLGSEVDLEQVVLQVLPAQNPYHLQKWGSAPVLSFILSLVFFIIMLFVSKYFSKEITVHSKLYFAGLFFALCVFSFYVYFELYYSIVFFFMALSLS